MAELSEDELYMFEVEAKTALVIDWRTVCVRLITEIRDLRTKVERLEGEVAEAIEKSEVSHDDA